MAFKYFLANIVQRKFLEKSIVSQWEKFFFALNFSQYIDFTLIRKHILSMHSRHKLHENHSKMLEIDYILLGSISNRYTAGQILYKFNSKL